MVIRAGIGLLTALAVTAGAAPPASAQEGKDGDQAAAEALSLLVETAGGQSTSASYPFQAGEGTTISGTLQFLSQEYPEWYGSEYNDLYSVTLATPQGAIVLATGNLNNSSWGAGSFGYSGGATTVEFSEDLSRFSGQTVELQLVVANVADTYFDSAVAVSNLRIDQRPPCSDDRLAEEHGMPSGGPARDRLDGLDRSFQGLSGARFTNLVEAVAKEAGISPGLLATNALTERSSTSAWLTADPVQTQQAGVDDWATLQGGIRDRIPGAPQISATPTSEVFENEQGREIPVAEFANGRDALRAMAWTLRYAEVRMTEDGWSDYRSLPANQRYTLARFAFNRGIPAAIDLVRQVGAGEASALVDEGDIGPSHPQRTATVRGAQAVHLANEVFGEGAGCE